MPGLKHLHTYAKAKTKHYFRCVHPECTHYTHRENLRGKKAMCKCGRDFILPETFSNNNEFSRPELKCYLCRNTKKNKAMRVGEAIIDSLLLTHHSMEIVLNKPKAEVAQEEFPLDDSTQLGLEGLEDDLDEDD